MSLRQSTRVAYASQYKTFVKFCETVNHNPLIPLSNQQICEMMVFYTSTHKHTTLGQFMSAVNYHNDLNQIPRFNMEIPLIKRVRAGLVNYYSISEQVDPKKPIGFTELAQFHSLIDHSTFEGAREWAIYLLGFFAILRRSEYIDSRIHMKHLFIHSLGLSITIPYSKTSLHEATVQVAKRNDLFCPVNAFNHYFSFIPSQISSIKCCSLFVSSCDSTAAVNHRTVLATLKRRLTAIGLDSSLYGFHSLRRGGTTAMFAAGVPETIIQSHGRWSSLTYKQYLDTTVSLEHSLIATKALMSSHS